MTELEIEFQLTRVCVYCGGYSETPRALCDICYVLHMLKVCEARPMSCHACNMSEMEGEDDVEL